MNKLGSVSNLASKLHSCDSTSKFLTVRNFMYIALTESKGPSLIYVSLIYFSELF